jgi:hypothetical protein
MSDAGPDSALKRGASATAGHRSGNSIANLITGISSKTRASQSYRYFFLRLLRRIPLFREFEKDGHQFYRIHQLKRARVSHFDR